MKKRPRLAAIIGALLAGAFCRMVPPVGSLSDSGLNEHLGDI